MEILKSVEHNSRFGDLLETLFSYTHWRLLGLHTWSSQFHLKVLVFLFSTCTQNEDTYCEPFKNTGRHLLYPCPHFTWSWEALGLG